MENFEKVELFERTPIPRAVVKLAVPTTISCLVMVLYNLADTFFVGMLGDSVQNAAVTLSAPVLLAFNAVNNLFGVGSSSMLSRALGLKDYETAKKSSAFGIYCAVFSGLLFSLLCTAFKSPLLKLLGTDPQNAAQTEEYLFWTVNLGAMPAILNVVLSFLVRAEGSALHGSIGTMSGCMLNMVIDPFFILPKYMNMGAAGAGCATFISNCIACLYFFVLLFVKRKSTFVCVDPRYFKPNRKVALGVCGVGVPASIQNLLNVTGMTILNNFTAEYSSDAVAAMGISHRVSMIPVQIAMGIAQGIMPLVSYNFASKNYGRMKKSIVFAGELSMIFLTAATVFSYIFSRQITAAFLDTPTVVEYGARFVRGMCLASPFLSLDFLAVGVFQACGMGGRSLVFAIMRKIILEIPALYVLNRLFPLYGLAYAQFTAEVILAAAAIIVLWRMFGKLSTPAN